MRKFTINEEQLQELFDFVSTIELGKAFRAFTILQVVSQTKLEEKEENKEQDGEKEL